MPDWTKKGRLDNIPSIPNRDGSVYWEETADCAGFNVSDSCPWRVAEMELVTYTPIECSTDENLNCEHLAAYARFQV